MPKLLSDPRDDLEPANVMIYIDTLWRKFWPTAAQLRRHNDLILVGAPLSDVVANLTTPAP